MELLVCFSASILFHALIFYRLGPIFQTSEFGAPGGEIYVTAVGEALSAAGSGRIRSIPPTRPAQSRRQISNNSLVTGHNIIPGYPEEARKNGWEGVVHLEIFLDPEGKAERVKLLSTSGHSILDVAALEAAQKWVFPKLSKSWVTVPVEFRLE